MIYTHDESARILELFEDLLERYGITVPSPEDDEREPDNDAKLYGTTYYDLLDEIEWNLISMCERVSEGEFVEPYVFSGMG